MCSVVVCGCICTGREWRSGCRWRKWGPSFTGWPKTAHTCSHMWTNGIKGWLTQKAGEYAGQVNICQQHEPLVELEIGLLQLVSSDCASQKMGPGDNRKLAKYFSREILTILSIKGVYFFLPKGGSQKKSAILWTSSTRGGAGVPRQSKSFCALFVHQQF